uniref:Uncharacterized protein n=1 Tax=viral metagenome TaxID=1070528 RepID=A0A6M3M872_9ZZZZ
MKTEKEVEEKLGELLADDRLSYAPALVDINAPLALIQTDLEAKVTILRWVLSDKEKKGGE